MANVVVKRKHVATQENDKLTDVQNKAQVNPLKVKH